MGHQPAYPVVPLTTGVRTSGRDRSGGRAGLLTLDEEQFEVLRRAREPMSMLAWGRGGHPLLAREDARIPRDGAQQRPAHLRRARRGEPMHGSVRQCGAGGGMGSRGRCGRMGGAGSSSNISSSGSSSSSCCRRRSGRSSGRRRRCSQLLVARVDVLVLQLLGLLEELHDEEKRHVVEGQVEQQRTADPVLALWHAQSSDCPTRSVALRLVIAT